MLNFNQTIRYNKEKTENGIKINVELPGYSKNDIKVTNNKNSLEIKIKEDKKYNIDLIDLDPFYSFDSHQQFNLNKTTAKMENGLLNLFIPFKEDSVNTIKIE